MTFKLCFLFLVLFFCLHRVDSFSCPARVISCASFDTKCIYTGYTLQDEERFRQIRVTTTGPGPNASIPLLYDNNVNTTYNTTLRPITGNPVVVAVDLRNEFFLTVIRLSIRSPSSNLNGTFTFRVVLGLRDQNPCTAAEYTGSSAEELIILFSSPTRARYIRVENIDNVGITLYNEIIIVGSPLRYTPFTEANFTRYNFSMKAEMAQSTRNLAGSRIEGPNVAFAFRQFWVTTPGSDAIIIRENLFPAAYRADRVPNKCLGGYGIGLPETSRSSRHFSFTYVNGLRITRFSLRLLNMGINNTDNATQVQAQLIGFRQGNEVYRSRVATSVYNSSRVNWNPCTVPSHQLYLDTPLGADRVDLVISHTQAGRLLHFSTEPVVISELTYELQVVPLQSSIVVAGVSPTSRLTCLNTELVNLQQAMGTEIRLRDVVVSVSRSFSQNSLIIVQQGMPPAAYHENNITNNCLGGAGVGLRASSKEPRSFTFDFGNRIVKQFSLTLVIGDADPFQENQISAQLVGWNGTSQVLSSLVEVDVAEARRKRIGACERDGRYHMLLQDDAGFSRVEFLTQAKQSVGFGSRLPSALSDICYSIDGVRTPPPPRTVRPVTLPRMKPFTPFGQCLSYELGEHSFDPTGVRVDGDLALPFRHLYVNTSINQTVIVQAGRYPVAYRVNGVPNDCLNGYGLSPLYPAVPILNRGFTFQFISANLVKHFGLNLINFGNENVDRAQVVQAQMVGYRDGVIQYVTPSVSIDYTAVRSGDWNPCTISEGHSFYMDPGPQPLDRIDLLFQHSLDGKTFTPGTSESVVISDVCYDTFDPWALPPAGTPAPTRSVPLVLAAPNVTVGSACLGSDPDDGNRTNPVGQPIAGPRAYAFSQLWVEPLVSLVGDGAPQHPIVVRKGLQPSLYNISGIANECMAGPLGFGYTRNKHLDVRGFDIKISNGRAVSLFSFQFINLEKFSYRLRTRGLLNGVQTLNRIYDIKGVGPLSSLSICNDATTWVSLGDPNGFDVIELRFEPASDLPISVNQVYFSSVCYKTFSGAIRG